jgi:hypothetical protein
MRQTAVQWFALKLMHLKMNPKEVFEFVGFLEEAKEMEKEQMREFYQDGFFIPFPSDATFEEIYNEKYVKQCTEN